MPKVLFSAIRTIARIFHLIPWFSDFFFILLCPGASYEKRIERVTLSKSGGGEETKKPVSAAEKMREKIVRRAACEFKHGMYANLGKRNS
jgi:hypothetical protein